MPPLFTEMSVSTVGDYVNALANLPHRRELWFRGQSNAKWPLTPGLARRGGKKWLAAEQVLLTRFRQNALPLVPAGTKTNTDWDWLLLMQHYGVQTRLLDWSENAMAGLYFAAVSTRGELTRGNGCVWVLDALGLNKETKVPELMKAIPTLGVSAPLEVYSPASIAGDLRPLSPVAVFAMRMFPRLVAQSAVFTLIHKLTTPLEELQDGAYVGRIMVPQGAKKNIARELRAIGMTPLSLFPELESVAVVAKGYLRR